MAVQLARTATVTGVHRHAGSLAYLYTPTGRQTVARGRDLTACRTVIGTGGALTRLPGGLEALQASCARNGGDRLLPPADARCILDNDYIFAVCGALLRTLRGRCGGAAHAAQHRPPAIRIARIGLTPRPETKARHSSRPSPGALEQGRGGRAVSARVVWILPGVRIGEDPGAACTA